MSAALITLGFAALWIARTIWGTLYALHHMKQSIKPAMQEMDTAESMEAINRCHAEAHRALNASAARGLQATFGFWRTPASWYNG